MAKQDVRQHGTTKGIQLNINWHTITPQTFRVSQFHISIRNGARTSDEQFLYEACPRNELKTVGRDV